MLLRAKVWTLALLMALVCSVGWIFIPGECVVEPVGSADAFLHGSVFSTFLRPFAFDWVYVLYLLLKLSPIALVALAAFHWSRRFDKLRAVAALFTLVLSGAVALHPYRAFSDVELIIVVSVWGIVILVAYESKASPGSALLALMSIQLLISEVYSGIGAYRGLPFWILVTCLSIVFSYGIFHYTRMLRHSVLGRYTQVRQIDPEAIARRNALLEQQRRLEQQGQKPG
jgi:hypothetical protein